MIVLFTGAIAISAMISLRLPGMAVGAAETS